MAKYVLKENKIVKVQEVMLVRIDESKDYFDEKKFNSSTQSYHGDLVVTKDMVKNGQIVLPVNIKEVDGDFRCNGIGLTSLEGCPEEIRGDFNCAQNNLTTLKGAPFVVFNAFICGNNKLKTLEGAPDKVNGSFECSENELKNLKGAPSFVRKGFSCDRNKLISLKGAPKTVMGDFWCSMNTKEFTKNDVEAVCKVWGKIWV